MKIIENCKDKEYDAIEGLNISRLCLLEKSPRHYRMNYKKESKAMQMGTIIHMAMLEPKKFKQLYVVEPENIEATVRDAKGKPTGELSLQPLNKKMPEHREILAKWREQKEAQGGLVLTQDQFDSLDGMLRSMLAEFTADQSVAALFAGQREVVCVKEMRGRLCKGRADVLVENHPMLGRVVVDVKKVGKEYGAQPTNFKRDIFNLNYDAKAQWYMELFGAQHFVWIAVEEKDPHAIGIYSAEQFLEIGKTKLKRWFETLERCEKSNVWPWYTHGIEDIYPSDWATKEIEEENWT